jgi:CRISPR-associated protein Csd1
MILQSLTSLYDRLAEDPANGLPMAGYSLQKISFCTVLSSEGKLIAFELRQQEIITIGPNGKEKKSSRALDLLVLGQAKPPGQGINPCLLWDNAAYALGFKSDDEKPERTLLCYEAFKAKHLEIKDDINDSSYSAVCTFLESWNSADLRFAILHQTENTKIADFEKRATSETDDDKKAQFQTTIDESKTNIETIKQDAEVANIDLKQTLEWLTQLQAVSTSFGVFQISGETKYVHQAPAVKTWWSSQTVESSTEPNGFCLVTGKPATIAAIHNPAIKGVADAQSSGAKLVSFNEQAYESFGKENAKKVGQGANSPISEEAAFAYCNALNWLLANRERRFRLGDATTVFWTDAPTPAEQLMPWMISGNTPQDPTMLARIQNILQRLASGTIGGDELGDPETPYYILGLSPNASRLSIRFWNTSTLGDLIVNLKKHFDDLRIVRQWDETNSKNPDPIAPTVFQLLRQTSRDADGIPPLLSGALIRAILFGTRYPESLITGVMNRIRVVEKKQQGEGTLDNVSYLRASILKAWLIRNHQIWLQQKKIMIKTALDKDSPSIAYQLGRLFAIYEQAQKAAHEFKLERTIRETMFSAASATPQAVFGRLDRLNKHHLAKLTIGSNRFYSDMIDEIHQKFAAPTFYPASLNLKEQSLFCIGYYHQRYDLRPQKNTPESTNA